MNSNFKFAIVGLGHIGKRHADIIKNTSQADLVAVVDIDDTLKNYITETLAVPFYTSLELLLAAKVPVDIICICTPNGLHASQVMKALENGIHVICEKPLALHKQDCLKIIDQSTKKDRKVFCVMQNRYSPSSQWLKEIITQNRLGKINLVTVNCFWNRDERYYNSASWRGTRNLDGGTLFTQFSHFVDTLYWLFGDITNISAALSNFNHLHLTDFEDTGVVSFDFQKGGKGILTYTTATWDKNMESSITILGESGSVKVGGQYMNEVEFCHIKDYEMPTLPAAMPANDYGHYKGSAANHEFVFTNVIGYLKGEKEMTTTLYEGMKVVEIIERIYDCSRVDHKIKVSVRDDMAF